MRKVTSSPRDRAIAEGYRSGLEEKVAAALLSAGVQVRYEEDVIFFTPPAKLRRYTPDFILPNGIIVETKGRFITADRQKHRKIQAEHPNLDIRFVFSNPRAKISKTSNTTYAAWCDRFDFQYARMLIPTAWINEARELGRIAAIERATRK